MTAAEMRQQLATVMDHEPNVYPRQSHYEWPQGVPAPTRDPEFYDAVANLLILNRGERVHIQSVLGGDPWSTHEAIEFLRSHGLVIKGELGKAGYTFLRYQRPRKEPATARQMRIPVPRAHKSIAGQTAFGGAA